ncbi:hypothetical protein [Pseudomonas sp. MPC6]|nr:hypothetical protein [Pseudomonas sp. MPC6]
MIDKREGETKKPIPSQEPYFPRVKQELPGKDVQPSQKKAPKQPHDN